MTEEFTLRDKALSLPQGHPARIAYRDYKRSQANIAEDIRTTGNTTSSAVGECATEQLRRATEKVEAAIAAGENERPVRHLEYGGTK